MEVKINVQKKKKKKSRKGDDLSEKHDISVGQNVIQLDQDGDSGTSKKRKKKKRNRDFEVNCSEAEVSVDIKKHKHRVKSSSIQEATDHVKSKKHKKKRPVVESADEAGTKSKMVSFAESCREDVLETQHRKMKKRKDPQISNSEDFGHLDESTMPEERSKKKHKKKKKRNLAVDTEVDPAMSDDQSIFITQTPLKESSPSKDRMKSKNKTSNEVVDTELQEEPPSENDPKHISKTSKKSSIGNSGSLTHDSDMPLIDQLMSLVNKMEFVDEDYQLDFEPPLLHTSGRTSVLTKEEREQLKAQGVVINTKVWRKREIAILQRNMLEFIESEGIPHPALLLGFIPSLRNKLKPFIKAKNFYFRLGKDLNDRSLNSIYKKARSVFSPYPKLDKLTSEEVCEILDLQAKKGSKWAEFARILNRAPDVIESTIRWRTSKKVSGPWMLDEDELLVKAVKKYSKKIGQKITDNNSSNLPWEKISRKVGTRNPSQCHQRWAFTLCFESKLDGATKWKKKYNACLIYLLYNGDANREEDVDWQEISNKIDVKCNTTLIKRKWRVLKYAIPDHANKTFDECTLFLYHRKLPELLKFIRWSMESLKSACGS